MSSFDQTVHIPHLGGSSIGATFGRPYDPDLPTVVLINSYTTSSELYRSQFDDEALNEAVNLIALEPYGHGRTRSTYPQFTYWDSAIANLQVLAALGIRRAFVVGTSQGGWISVRMALLAPDVVQGLMPRGTSMDVESQRSRDLGCWDGPAFCTPFIEEFADPVDEDWVVPDQFVDDTFDAALGGLGEQERSRWLQIYEANYAGDEGRRRLRLSTINLRDRDGLHGRVDEVKAPVLWLHGSVDQVYSVAHAEQEIGLFSGAADARLEIVEDGHHFLSASKPAEVNAALMRFVSTWAAR